MRVVVAAFFLLLVHTAHAAEQGGVTGNDVLAACTHLEGVTSGTISRSDPRANEDIYMQGVCTGITDGVEYLAYLATKGSNVAVCIPDNASHGQLLRVVLKFMRDRPDLLNERFAMIVLTAYASTWPCK